MKTQTEQNILKEEKHDNGNICCQRCYMIGFKDGMNENIAQEKARTKKMFEDYNKKLKEELQKYGGVTKERLSRELNIIDKLSKEVMEE